ncbi:MAG: hypothetical protein DMD81_12400 [Candidatus Rokuibacteriota bacterium]|nr:MAG: hypothetical protein DMD81_12400 [Candidatus Rokubacteria bacterium]
MTDRIVSLTEMGWKAHAALLLTGGTARVVTALTESVYLDAGGTLVWLGRADATRHPRAMLTRDTLAIGGDVVRVDLSSATPWTAAPVVLTADSAANVGRGGRKLREAIVASGLPDGLGLLLADPDAIHMTPGASIRPEIVALLQRAAPPCLALSCACRADDPTAAIGAASALLGLGPGLTPSGDDFVGGALFARALLSRAPNADRIRWAEAGREIVRRARDLTHPISVALLEDMIDGDGHAPLHDVARALVSDDGNTALDAARRLVRIGHSSGWDILAGFLATVATL